MCFDRFTVSNDISVKMCENIMFSHLFTEKSCDAVVGDVPEYIYLFHICEAVRWLSNT